MNTKRAFQISTLIVCVIILLSGCLGKLNVEKPNPGFASITDTATSRAIHATPSVTVTEIPTQTSTPTHTITPTVTRTPMDELFTPWLVGEIDCVQPCLFGITPGVTTFDELQSIIIGLRIGLDPDPRYFVSSIYAAGYDFDSLRDGIFQGLVYEFHISQNVVDGIAYHYETDPGGVVPRRNWQNLLPETIMKTYGVPTSIQIFLSYNVESTNKNDPAFGYHLLFIYDDIHTIFSYTSDYKNRTVKNAFPICPGKDNLNAADGWMGVYAPNPPTRDDQDDISMISDMEPITFTEQFLNNPRSFCLNVHRKE